MSLNFSIDSILRHGNVESSNSTLIGSNKLNQANFLKKQLNHQQLNTYLASANSSSSTAHPVTTNGLNSANQLNDATLNTPSQLQSPLFYLNKAAANPTSVINLMDSVQTNGSTANSLNSSAFAFELNQLNQLSHLSPFELCRINQLTRFQSQLVSIPYLSKINSLYNDESLNSNNGRSNNQFDNHSHHITNSNNHHHKLTLENNASSKAAFLTLATNGASTLLCGSNSGFNGVESQCSPLSDKSCEMLLNYDDSSDSNRMSQHSGNNISINSNNSNPNGKHSADKNSSNKQSSKEKDTSPLCTKCKLHGIHNLVKGHKKKCPKKDCTCELCILTDYGKRLRGKKGKKASVAAGLLSAASVSAPATNLTNLMMDSLNEAASMNNLNGLNHNLNNHLNENGALFNASTVVNLTHHHQSTTPNSSNSNSSCSTVSLRNHPPPSSLPTVQQSSSSSSICNSLALNQQLTNLHSGIGFLEKNVLKDYMKMVIYLLKEKLAQDGLNYEQELDKLKFAVIYLLLNRFDKNELLTKLITDA